MSEMQKVADALTKMDRSGVRMLVGTYNADGTVQIGASAIPVPLWINRPGAAGRKAVVLMQDGSAVGLGTDSPAVLDDPGSPA